MSVTQHRNTKHPRTESFPFSAVKTQNLITQSDALRKRVSVDVCWHGADVLFRSQQLSIMLLKLPDFPRHSCQSFVTMIYNKEGWGLVHWGIKKDSVGPLFIRSSHQCSFIQPGETQAISGCKQLCNQHLWASNNQSLEDQSLLSHEYLPCNYWHDDRGNTSASTNRLPSNYNSVRKSTTRMIKTIPLSSALEVFFASIL